MGAIALGSALALAALPASAQDLSPQELFRRVAPSVVVVEVTDSPKKGQPKLIASGSGVVVPDRAKDEMLIATNCHVVDQAGHGFITIRQGDEYGLGWTEARDPERDLCLVRAVVYDEAKSTKDRLAYKKLPAAQIGSSQWLEVGDPVYAVGAPQGLELSLSNGLVSGFRGYKGSEYIQTTAPISKGSSGGGLFDARGRLIGITTMYLKEGQALNFAIPAELIASVPEVRTGVKRSTQASNRKPQAVTRASSDNERWMYVTENQEGGVVYLDRRTIRREGPDVTAWWKTTYEAPRTDKAGDKYDESAQLGTFYCTARQVSLLSTVQRFHGEVIYSYDRKSYELKRSATEPDTIGEAILEAACSL